MNSLHRLLKILDIFEDGTGVFTADQLLTKLGYTRSTTYRYLKALSDAGLLSSWHGSGYTLGPRIIEFGALISQRDPLLLVSRVEMQRIGTALSGAVLLNRRYRDKALCVHVESTVPGLGIGVGHSRALTTDAGTRVMLSHFTAQQLRKFYDRNGEGFAKSGIGSSLIEVRNRLRDVRAAGFDTDLALDDAGFTSIAAPIIDGNGAAIASITLAVPPVAARPEQLPALAQHVMEASRNICRAIAA